MKNFEEILNEMSKPEINNLKHEDLLAKAIISSKSKSALSFWWIIIPIYVIAAFLMKSLFVPHNSLRSNLDEFAVKNEPIAILLFIVIPILVIIINLVSIKNIYFLLRNTSSAKLFMSSFINILFILISLIIMLLYLL
jgi:hypothetical protein